MNNVFNQAVKEVNNLNSGEEFLVKDLFKGYEWKRLSINERRDLGRDFFKPDRNPHLKNHTITPLHKNSANQQIYKKN